MDRKHRIMLEEQVKAAWETHCSTHDLDPKDKAVRQRRDPWYRSVLFATLGVYTTKECNNGEDFDRLVVKFEQLAGKSSHWLRKVNQSRLRRVRYALQRAMDEHDLDSLYVAGIAAQMGYGDDLTRITDPDKLKAVLVAVQKHAARHLTTEPVTAGQSEDEPF